MCILYFIPFALEYFLENHEATISSNWLGEPRLIENLDREGVTRVFLPRKQSSCRYSNRVPFDARRSNEWPKVWPTAWFRALERSRSFCLSRFSSAFFLFAPEKMSSISRIGFCGRSFVKMENWVRRANGNFPKWTRTWEARPFKAIEAKVFDGVCWDWNFVCHNICLL